MGPKSYHLICVGYAQPSVARFGQPIAGVLAHSANCFQPVAKRHKFINFGDDAVLFGEGR